MAQTPGSRLCKGFEGCRRKAYGWKIDFNRAKRALFLLNQK